MAAAATRRAVMAGTSAFVLMPRPAAAIAPTSLGLRRLYREADEVLRMGRELDARRDASEAEWLAWEARDLAFMREVEALPVNRETAGIKARAVEVSHNEKLDELGDGNSTDLRLMRQVIRAMAGAV